MTATEELRRLLDERGVEHWDTVGITEYRGENDRTVRCYARPEPLTVDVSMVAVLPAQAIDATLGRGTCKVDSFADVRFTEEDNQGHDYEYATLAECSECGAILLMPPPYIWYDDDSLYAATNFCPNCGRKVASE